MLALIGNPGCRRVRLLQEALAAAGQPPARLLPWAEVLDGLPVRPAPGERVRLESPGGCWEVHRRLLALGADAPGEGERIGPEEAMRLPDDGSGLRWAGQQHAGFQRALGRLAAETPAGTRWATPPSVVAELCDKAQVHARLEAAGLPVAPRVLARTLQELDATGARGAMVKLRYGSSAAGMAAFRRARGRRSLVTSLAWDGLVPYSTLRLRRLRQDDEIDLVLRWLLAEGAHVERWLPKARLDGAEFDLRVVVVAGQAAQVAVRVARRGSPMTNLHLGNARGDPEAARRAVGPERWEEALDRATAAARLYPEALCVGVDLMITPGRGPVLLELNAFGDLLPGILWRGLDTYGAQVQALRPSAPGA